MGDDKSEAYQKGVEAGLEGKTSDDNPNERGVIESVIGGALGVATAGMTDPLGDADEAASDWESGRKEGEALAEKSSND